MRSAFGLALAAIVCAAPARAASGDVESGMPEKVEVTIYREGNVDTEELDAFVGAGLVMVRETRTIDLPAGASRILFLNVADHILPQSAAIEGLPSDVIERNFDYDLMSPGAILEKSVGAPVRLVRTNPRTGAETTVDATIRTGEDGVVLDIAGKIEALHCSGLPERLVFDHIPETLATKPTLSALIEAPRAGRYQIRLSYLATGLLWSADYTARFAPDGQTLTLSAWVTLANNSETTFAGAPTEVVAGRLSWTADDVAEPYSRNSASKCWPIRSARGRLPPPLPPPPPPPAMFMPAPVAIGGDIDEVVVTAQRIDARDLGDVKLYAVPEPTTVAANQIKQVQFLYQPGVKAERLYRFTLPAADIDDDNDAPQQTIRMLRLVNDRAHGLGLPLPQGKLAAYEQSGDDYLFTGAGSVGDVPAGSPLDIALGPANDVTVRTTRVEEKEISDTERRIRIAVEINNGKTSPAVVELAMLPEANTRLTRQDRRYRMREGLMIWPFALAANKTQTFEYTVVVRD